MSLILLHTVLQFIWCYLLIFDATYDVYIDSLLCVYWYYVFCFFFLIEFLPKCYALLLMAFDRHTINVYLLTYLLTYLYT